MSDPVMLWRIINILAARLEATEASANLIPYGDSLAEIARKHDATGLAIALGLMSGTPAPSTTAGQGIGFKGDYCKTCRDPMVPIVFSRQDGVPNSGANPIDARPDPEGNIVFTKPGHYRILSGAEQNGTIPLPPGTDRYFSHYVTCPRSRSYRKKPVT